MKKTIYGDYYISPEGICVNKKGKQLKQHLDSQGRYLQVCLCHKGKPKYFLVHRLVALAYLPNPENKPCVNHKDGVITNNHANNLEWVTYSENSHHAYHVLGHTRGTVPMKGKFAFDHNRSKAIKVVTKEGDITVFGSVSDLARKEGTSYSLGAYILKTNAPLPFKVKRGTGKGVIVLEYPAT